MSTPSHLSQDEAMATIKKTVATTFTLSVAAMSGAYNYLPTPLPGLPAQPTTSDRLVLTLQYHTLTMVVVYFIFSLVGAVRAKDAWDPTNPATAHLTEVPNKILTNTVEQALMFIPSTLILSTYLAEHQMALIPIFIIMFAVGRLLFAIGYLKHPLYRAPGFALGASVLSMTMAANVWFTLCNHTLAISLPTLAVAIMALRNFKM
eukprot:TRINITY_DN22792_c0_g1_i2.p1 TRINITY_DN22792_c0_g1~~TRINITY_DN22792_c0_g1_i2.p1  ORF type:complete len:212 (-),score=54.16 TRINITY_DN22792_c0_g1_i2:61-675(-)